MYLYLGRCLYFCPDFVYFSYPVLDELRLVETEGDFVELVFYFEVIRFLQIFGRMSWWKLSVFDIVVGIVVLVFGIQVKVNVVLAHYCSVLLPHSSQGVLNVHHPYLRCLVFDLRLLGDSMRDSFSLLLEGKALSHLQQILIKFLIESNWQVWKCSSDLYLGNVFSCPIKEL